MNYDGSLHTKFSIKTNKQPDGWWSFGACISHMEEETYLFINFFKWSVAIGFLYEFNEEEYDEF